jgi:hypothetical protein
MVGGLMGNIVIDYFSETEMIPRMIPIIKEWLPSEIDLPTISGTLDKYFIWVGGKWHVVQ